MKRVTLLILVMALVLLPTQANASNALKTRYTTQTVSLRERSTTKARSIYKVKSNTKVELIKTGKVWARVKYKGKELSVQKKCLATRTSPKLWTMKKFRRRGVIRWNGYKWTWYSQRILPGRGLKIPGQHLDKNGFVCDKDDYICLASSRKNKKAKKIIPTPFGKFGKVYDCGGGGSKWADVYMR